MDEKPTILLPRLENESARAYAARVEYVTMGAQRSQDAVSQKLAKSRQLLSRWSVQYDWIGSARKYDEEMSYITVQESADAYRQDLADYRKRYGEMGKALFQASALLLRRVIEQSKTIEVGVGSLTLITNAAKTAADLEALALRVENLLSDERSSEQ